MLILVGIVLGAVVLLISLRYNHLHAMWQHHQVPDLSDPMASRPSVLSWLERHQQKNGSWPCDVYQDLCLGEDGEHDSVYRSDLIYSSLGILCYLGNGHDHKTPGKFKKTVNSALGWLLSQQTETGLWSQNNYEQALAVLTISEAYAMTMDPKLKAAAIRGQQHLATRRVHMKHKSLDIYGWCGQEADKSKIDVRATAWCVMALKAGKSAGFKLDECWEDAKQLFRTICDLMTRDTGGRLLYPRHINVADAEPETFCVVDGTVALSLVFLGYRPGDAELDMLVGELTKMDFTDTTRLDPLAIYKSSLAVFQYGGEYWRDYNKNRLVLLDTQDQGWDCRQGSIDPACFNCSSRFEATTFVYLSSQIYYAYTRPGDVMLYF